MKTKIFLLFGLLLALVAFGLSINYASKLNAKIDELQATQKMENDSIKALYASLIVPCVPDTAFYVAIPENVKTAWLTYYTTIQIARNKFSKCEELVAQKRTDATERASKEYEKKEENANNAYRNVQNREFVKYVQQNPIYISSLNTKESRTYIYLESTDNFWSASIEYEIGNTFSNKKCPEDFKKMLEECKLANTESNQIKSLAKQILDKQTQEAERVYQESIVPAQKIFEESKKLAYYDFRLKTRKDW